LFHVVFLLFLPLKTVHPDLGNQPQKIIVEALLIPHKNKKYARIGIYDVFDLILGT